MLQRAESELRKTGSPQDTKLAHALAARIKERGDFPLSSGVSVARPENLLEIPTVNEKLYAKTREVLVKRGFAFVATIEQTSVSQLAANVATKSLFDYINPSKEMRSRVPPQMEVAINPNQLRIRNSNSKSTDTQISMIQKEEVALKRQLPEDVEGLISMIMPKYASILAQLDFEHQKRMGRVLFTNWFGRTDDQTVPGNVVGVGRIDPTNGLLVLGWRRGRGAGNLFAVPVVVLPRKLAV